MSEERRLHPLSWLFAAAQAAKGFIVPLVVLLFASGGSNPELWAALFIVPATLGAVVQYLVFRYQLGSEELVVLDGLLTRTERHIPYARIQNINLGQNPLHRLLKVALVRIETSSGSKPEVVIRVLSLDAIHEMRALVFADRKDAGAGVQDALTSSPAEVILRLSGAELAKLGIVSNKGLVVVSAALGLLWQQGGWWQPEDIIERNLESERLSQALSNTPIVAGVVAVIGIMLAAVIALRLLSIAWFQVQLYDFTLRRRSSDLRAEYGLFTKISRTIPTFRIQSLTTLESPLHRWFGRQSVELRTVGGAGDDLDAGLQGTTAKAKSQWLAPMIATGRVPALVREVLPQSDLAHVEWVPIAERAWLRIFRRWLIVVGALTTLAAGLIGSWSVLVFAIPAALMALAHSRLYVKHAAYSLTPWGLVYKSGWWDRTMMIVRYNKIQTVERGETPFDRRSRMASIRVDTAGADRVGHTIDIPFLEASIAVTVAQRLTHEASRHEFRW